jgi:hypothetical protein
MTALRETLGDACPWVPSRKRALPDVRHRFDADGVTSV